MALRVSILVGPLVTGVGRAVVCGPVFCSLVSGYNWFIYPLLGSLSLAGSVVIVGCVSQGFHCKSQGFLCRSFSFLFPPVVVSA